MKDEDQMNTEWIESAWTDFLDYHERKDFTNCQALADATEENGYASDAKKMRSLLPKEVDLEFIPYEHDEPLPILPEEDDTPAKSYAGYWKREGDENFPV